MDCLLMGIHQILERGKAYYRNNPDTTLYPPKFVQAFVQRENINELIREAGFAGGR